MAVEKQNESTAGIHSVLGCLVGITKPPLVTSFRGESCPVGQERVFVFYCKSAFVVEAEASTPGVSNLRTPLIKR